MVVSNFASKQKIFLKKKLKKNLDDYKKLTNFNLN